MLPQWFFMLGNIINKIIIGFGVFLIAFAVFLVIRCFYLNNAVDKLKKENTTLQGEKNALYETIKGYENAKVESDKTIKMLRDAAEQDKNNLYWYHQRVPADVLSVLQKRHNRDKAN